MNHIIDQMTEWLRTQVKQAHVKGLVVGVSGGLDSAVVAYLIQKAFPDNSLGVIMPLHSNSMDTEDADKVVKGSNIRSLTVDLTNSHSRMYGEIQAQLQEQALWNEKKNQLADANLRARLRMGTLYTIATQLNYLVVGTDNAAEWHTGYFTKYGDGGVDIQPIIQLTKKEVGDMAEVLGVPNSVIQKRPSADLWEGQTDEQEMGTSYHYIDAYLQGKPVPKEDRIIIEQLHEKTAHKRKIATPFVFR